MDERLSDERVADYATMPYDYVLGDVLGPLAREVQEWRTQFVEVEQIKAWMTTNVDKVAAQLSRDTADAFRVDRIGQLETLAREMVATYDPIDALCARHDIDIDGIVRLVDREMKFRAEWELIGSGGGGDRCTYDYRRRLARGES